MSCYVMFYFVLFSFVLFCFILFYFVMLCYVMLCYVMLCYVMLCYVMLCYVMLCYDRSLISNQNKLCHVTSRHVSHAILWYVTPYLTDNKRKHEILKKLH